jgi:tryptophan-rich sensory protein
MRGLDRWTVAWFLGCVAFAVHIAEEIAYGSFGVYADLDVFLTTLFPSLRLPEYRYEVWLADLIGAAVLLFAFTWLVYTKRGPMRLASYLFATFLTANGMGHLYAALTMETYFPGAVTAGLLVLAGLFLFVAIPHDNSSKLAMTSKQA